MKVLRMFLLINLFVFVSCLEKQESSEKSSLKNNNASSSLSVESAEKPDFEEFKEEDEGCSSEEDIEKALSKAKKSNEPMKLQGQADCTVN